MKKLTILTSILALAACGGGGGGSSAPHGIPQSPSTPSTPTSTTPEITVQGFSGGQTVNTNNANLTNMSSYVMRFGTDEDTTKQAMIDYVNTHLGSSRGALLNRAASTRNTRDFTDQEFAAADAALTQMKQIIHDMVIHSEESDAALTEYVTQYKTAVTTALKLADQPVTDESTVDELVAAFNDFKDDLSLTSANLIAAMDAFDSSNFDFTKYRMERPHH